MTKEELLANTNSCSNTCVYGNANTCDDKDCYEGTEKWLELESQNV